MHGATKLGLVLSGGGAKGAYQAGVVRYLAEKNIQPDAVAGASIGSLNSAVVAAANNIQQAADELEHIWRFVAEKSPVKVDSIAVSVLMLRMVLLVFSKGKGRILAIDPSELSSFLPEKYRKYLADVALLDNAPSIEILQRYGQLDSAADILPFWVSVYRSDGVVRDLLNFFTAEFTFGNTKDSEFLCMNTLVPEDKLLALLASSAIPFAYERQTIDGVKYSDGGLGGLKMVQGNTPVTPLVEQARCSHIIVTHLQDGSMWDRNRFPDTTFLEIRPSGITKSGLLDMLKFETAAISDWMSLGYEDAKVSLAAVEEALSAFRRHQTAKVDVAEKVRAMKDALSWLKD